MCEKCDQQEFDFATRFIDQDDCAPTHCAIQAFMHCKLCLAQLPPNKSPAEYARLNFGLTPHGMQLWCTRHNANVAHFVIDKPIKVTSQRETRRNR